MGSGCSCEANASVPEKYDAPAADMGDLASSLDQIATGAATGGTPAGHPNIRRVLMLYTGGTIGMKASDHGYICVKGYLPEVLRDLAMFNDKEFNLEKEGITLPEGYRDMLPLVTPVSGQTPQLHPRIERP